MWSVYHSRRFLKNFKRNYCTEIEDSQIKKQVFSAIQPTGDVHLGNYIGAIRLWVNLQNEQNNTIFSIADLHSLTSLKPQKPKELTQNILLMTATLLASGIDPDKSVLYQQSAVKEHAELCWIFTTLSTTAKLTHLPQYKEKSALLKEIPLGLYMYPVLQVADIALHKATHVPVGDDQKQHIHYASNLFRAFNQKYGTTFPITKILLDESCSRIKSLSQPDKKMSKSETCTTATIFLTDSPDLIVQKCKKALTDFKSEVTFEPENRPGISNLLSIHSSLTGKTTDDICNEVKELNTGQYKLHLAEVIIEALKPIRRKLEEYMKSPDYLINVLNDGADKARETASLTMQEVKTKVGFQLDVVNVDLGKITTSMKP